MKKTEWFPASTHPVRVGYYEVIRPSMHGTPWYECRMRWNGAQWRYSDGGYSDFGMPWEGGCMWRGLTEAA